MSSFSKKSTDNLLWMDSATFIMNLNKNPTGFIKKLYESGNAKPTIMFILESYVDLETNTFSIPHELWHGWRQGDPDLFLDCLNEFIDKHQLELPYPFDQTECVNDFCKLVRLEATDLLKGGNWSHTFDYKYEQSKLYIDNAITGNYCTSSHNLVYRCETRGKRKASAVEIWRDSKARRTALNVLKVETNTALNNRLLNNIMRNRGCSVSQFKPSVAKCIYEYYGAKKVYDFSAGWGDRLVAALATPGVQEYHGTDPNSQLQTLYSDLLDMFNSAGKKVSILTKPAEEYVPQSKDFDLVFTSCPYFNLEKYAVNTHDEDKQSWKRYSTKDDWLTGFLFPAIKNAWSVLKKGGRMVLNIADFQDGKRVELVDLTNDFIANLKGAQYEGCLGMRLNKRVARKAEGVFAEPIWVWIKN